MLKSAIAASISIASLLSLASMADARSIDQTSIHQPLSQSTSHLIAKQSKSPTQNISESDLKGIQQAITARYLDKNQILEKGSSNSRRFYEIKSLKLISFSGTTAQVKIEEDIRNYELLRADHPSSQERAFQKVPGTEYTKHIFSINLEKFTGKWKINK